MKKNLFFYIVTIGLTVTFLIYSYILAEEERPTYQFKGKVVAFSDSSITMLSDEDEYGYGNEESPVPQEFRIKEETEIEGELKEGVRAKVTYVKRRFTNRMPIKIAILIEVEEKEEEKSVLQSQIAE